MDHSTESVRAFKSLWLSHSGKWYTLCTNDILCVINVLIPDLDFIWHNVIHSTIFTVSRQPNTPPPRESLFVEEKNQHTACCLVKTSPNSLAPAKKSANLEKTGLSRSVKGISGENTNTAKIPKKDVYMECGLGWGYKTKCWIIDSALANSTAFGLGILLP